jgi:hypothetical protein
METRPCGHPGDERFAHWFCAMCVVRAKDRGEHVTLAFGRMNGKATFYKEVDRLMALRGHPTLGNVRATGNGAGNAPGGLNDASDESTSTS